MPSHLDNPRPFRIQRSELAVPATSSHLFEKAAQSCADFVFLDLEDSVAPDKKKDGRRNVIAALNDINWGGKTMAVRINALNTEWAHRDIVEIGGQCRRLDVIMLPRAGAAFDVQFVDQLLTGLEKEHGHEKRIGIETIVETAQGLANVEQIAASSSRLEAIIFGIGDYSIDMHAYDAVIGTSSVERDLWQYARARIANACRAFGLRPIDGPFTKYADLAGLRSSAEYVAALGFEGKWAIHPTQVAICNDVFSPTRSQIEWAERTVRLMTDAMAQGKGAVGQNGAIVDMAHARLARTILQRAAAFDSAPDGGP